MRGGHGAAPRPGRRPGRRCAAVAAGGSARTTTSVPAGSPDSRCRTSGRSRRVTRCRTTELPTLPETTNPARGASPSPGAAEVHHQMTGAGSSAGTNRRGEIGGRAQATDRREARVGAGVGPIRPTARRGPCDGARPGSRGRHGSASAAGSRGSWRDDDCSAERCACSRRSLHGRCCGTARAVARCATGLLLGRCTIVTGGRGDTPGDTRPRSSSPGATPTTATADSTKRPDTRTPQGTDSRRRTGSNPQRRPGATAGPLRAAPLARDRLEVRTSRRDVSCPIRPAPTGRSATRRATSLSAHRSCGKCRKVVSVPGARLGITESPGATVPRGRPRPRGPSPSPTAVHTLWTTPVDGARGRQ